MNGAPWGAHRAHRRVRRGSVHPMSTPAPIATPEEVAAAINILSRASGLGFTVHAALDIVLPALASSNAEIERLKERLRSAEATVDTFMRAQEHYREAMDERNTFKNAARAAEAQVAALTEQVRKLREALEDQPEAGDDDFYQLGWRHAMERCRAALSPTEPEAELAVMKAAAASLNASVVAGSALMAEENLDRQELKQRARTAEASSLTARRDALEEAAKVADREQDECAEHEDNAFTDSVAARWSAAADAAHRIAAGIRTLASTVPGGEETGWRSMESAPRGRHVLLIDTSSGTHVFHSVGFRPPGGGPWETDAGHYMEFTPTGWMALLPPPHEMKEEDLG